MEDKEFSEENNSRMEGEYIYSWIKCVCFLMFVIDGMEVF
jgi:hypothetical protein